MLTIAFIFDAIDLISHLMIVRLDQINVMQKETCMIG